MAFDFPNSPSVGQRVTGVGGIVYVWDGVKWASNIGSVTAQSMGDVGRNLLHNPLFNVAQRGAGPFTSVGAYTLDRWRLLFSADTNSVSAAGLVDAQRAAIGDEAAVIAIANTFTGTAGAGSYSYLQQSIEGVRRLAGKTVTVSLWAVAGSGTPKLGISLLQYFGTGGAPSASVVINGTSFPITTTFARYTVTFTIPSAAGKTLGTNNDDSISLLLWFSSGATNATQSGNIGVQSGTIALWGVQLEIGSVATPLEKPDPRYDLANCQRFYQSGIVFGAVASALRHYDCITVLMRATPTTVRTYTGTAT